MQSRRRLALRAFGLFRFMFNSARARFATAGPLGVTKYSLHNHTTTDQIIVSAPPPPKGASTFVCLLYKNARTHASTRAHGTPALGPHCFVPRPSLPPPQLLRIPPTHAAAAAVAAAGAMEDEEEEEKVK